MTPFRALWTHPLLRAGLALVGLGLSASMVARFALRERHAPDRCPEGMAPLGARCCGAGQTLQEGSCAGPALGCSIGQELNDAKQCVARFGVVSFEGGELFIGAADWDGASGGERFPRTRVAPFRLDVSEVTRQRYGASSGEPGLPMTNLSVDDAEAFCRRERGRLPTAAEWVFAAAGAEARRYAWGNSGLVCRRAAFGLVHGPCAQGSGPELSGSRPDGASPDGLMDLAGNVAEWTREPNRDYSARGGSYRSSSAAELKSWAALPDREKALYIGFRCAYPP
jgi:formylglycine-generating enzyme required for sulfatase activity